MYVHSNWDHVDLGENLTSGLHVRDQFVRIIYSWSWIELIWGYPSRCDLFVKLSM